MTWDFFGNQPAGLTAAGCAGLRVLGVAPAAVVRQAPQEIVLRYVVEAAYGDAWDTTAATPWVAPGQSGVLIEF